ncbi:MAG: methyl-accepting chemotaxis protein [Candidatus Cloacimonetes bacterium]|jgi:iron only hydrogenase large subunit-like protein/ABC-type transporter Mla subunit MlaD|nr:methyl-accepting chemotaxis protein [Candidatus Cloacimonadota bacterium]
MNLSKVVYVDEEKCVNCHQCIAVCPVSLCNNGSLDFVTINDNLCIGCGRCVDACRHDARFLVDDSQRAFDDLKRGVKAIAVVAPAIAVSFPDNELKINTLLKNIGVEAVFDVSFGAELTIKSYLEYVKTKKPKLVIAQPCPAIVSYIEIYKPELLPYLAPADSPMLHTVKMVKEFYPQYKNHKVIIISPCVAKKREFIETSLGDYNLTIYRLEQYIEKNRININSLKETEYDSPPAERAVGFSAPGGLLLTAIREVPGIFPDVRKIEGEMIYEYLDGLYEQLEKRHTPLIIDCLNCEKGCNGGPGTSNDKKHLDELEYYTKKRMQKQIDKYNKLSEEEKDILRKNIDKYWKPGLYDRKYINLKSNNNLRQPNDQQLKEIYLKMNKTKPEDFKHCSSCGYNDCETMAIAIFNGLNKINNCHFYLQDKIKDTHKKHNEIVNQATAKIHDSLADIDKLNVMLDDINNQSQSVVMLIQMLNEIYNKFQDCSVTVYKENDNVNNLVHTSKVAEEKIKTSSNEIIDIQKNIKNIFSITEIINDISSQTNLLALNAKIQAVHAGDFGKGFGVISDEIKILANSVSENANQIHDMIENVTQQIKIASQSSTDGLESFNKIAGSISYTTESFATMMSSMKVIEQKTTQSVKEGDNLSKVNRKITENCNLIEKMLLSIRDNILNLETELNSLD